MTTQRKRLTAEGDLVGVLVEHTYGEEEDHVLLDMANMYIMHMVYMLSMESMALLATDCGRTPARTPV